MNSDYLYHLGMLIGDTKNTIDVERQFGDVKFVCLGGTKVRMEILARHLRSVLGIDENEELVDLCEKAHRYAVFKVGPVLCCSHGIGMSTMGVLLHELIKLVSYAKCKGPVFIRIGTSGGIGVRPGTVVVTKDAFNGYLRNEHEIAILGKRIVRPAKFDEDLVADIIKCREPTDDFDVSVGNTMAAECFYEGQGRLDGASCDYTAEDKMEFLKKCHAVGIRNIEMEATMFSALTRHIGIRAADVCVTLLNRLNGDQVDLTKEQKEDFEKRPLHIVGRTVTLKNNNICNMSSDFLYHLGILIANTKDTSDIQKQFGDVKLVCLGGTKSRMEELATQLREILSPKCSCGLVDISEKANRYAMYKVGPVLCCSHGIGMPSMSIVLHEVIKLVSYAKCEDPIFVRIGTCGGLGLEPGTIVVTQEVFNGYLRNEYELPILGNRVVRPTKFNEDVSCCIASCKEASDRFDIVVGNTMSTDCFYEGQGRLDGASCDYTEEDKMTFLQKVHSLGIKNIEMETGLFASLTAHLNIKAAAVCVTIVNRLNGDQVNLKPEEFQEIENRPLIVIKRFVKKLLKL